MNNLELKEKLFKELDNKNISYFLTLFNKEITLEYYIFIMDAIVSKIKGFFEGQGYKIFSSEMENCHTNRYELIKDGVLEIVRIKVEFLHADNQYKALLTWQ